MEATNPHLSLVAGNGEFPLMFARAAQAKNQSVCAIAFRGETDRTLEKWCERVTWIEVGQLQKMIDSLLSFPSRQVAFAGGVKKVRLFFPSHLDARGLSVIKNLLTKKDDAMLRAIARELEADGLEVVSSTLFLQEAMAPLGVLTERAPSEEEWRDIHFGFELAKEISKSDIGQTLVVKKQMGIAVEAIEGTDACILRGGKLSNGNAVVIKVLKPEQDTRFDLPAVGPGTIKSMRKAAATALALEAKQVLLIQREQFINLANRHKISVVGWNGISQI